MKNELKISTVSIVCVLCASVVSGANAASSVRSLGGAGTYSSAASASQSGTSTGVARAGSVRVVPTTGKTTAVKPANSPSTSAGRVAASPRLSLGKYLGGHTAISGGSSTRPGGGTGGGSTGGGTIDPGLAAELNNRVNVLEDTVSDLKDLPETKQDKLTAGNYITIDESGEVFLDVDALGADTTASVANGKLMLSIAGGAPIELVQLSDLLSADDMNAVIDDALEAKGFVTQTALDDVVSDVTENATAISGLTANVSNKADKQTDATKDTIAVIGDNGQYVGSDKKLADFATTAQLKELADTIPTDESFAQVQENITNVQQNITNLQQTTNNFDQRMTTLQTTVENNMKELNDELAGVSTNVTNVSNKIANITNEDGSLYIAPKSITEKELADKSVTTAKLADNSVTNDQLAQGAVKKVNLDAEVANELVGTPTGENPNNVDGMYVMLVNSKGEHIWVDLATETASTESGGATN